MGRVQSRQALRRTGQRALGILRYSSKRVEREASEMSEQSEGEYQYEMAMINDAGRPEPREVKTERPNRGIIYVNESQKIRTSEHVNELYAAFARAQKKFEAAAKVAGNPVYKSKYADISSVIEATLEHLNDEGIGVRQHPGLEYKQ